MWQRDRIVEDLRAIHRQRDELRELWARGERHFLAADYHEPWTRLAGDQAFFIVAARHLHHALELFNAAVPGAVSPLPDGLAEHVRILRNCVEHWNERVPEWHPSPSRRAGEAYDQLEELVGHRDADKLRWSGDFTRIQIAGLDVGELVEQVEQLRARFEQIEQSPSWIWSTELPDEL